MWKILLLHFWLFSFHLHANEIELLPDEIISLGKRVHAIRSCRPGETIRFSTFIFAPDKIGKVLAFELAKAADRGVKIQLMVDAGGTWGFAKSSGTLLQFLTSKGIDVRWINSLAADPMNSNRRMHDKIMMIGHEFAILGGRNIWDPSYGISAKPQLDMEVMVRGETTISTIVEYWQTRWDHSSSQKITTKPSQEESQAILKDLKQNYIEFTQNKMFEKFEQALLPPQFEKVNSLKFISDNRWKNYFNLPQFIPGWQTWDHIDELESLVEKAKSEIFIESPWIVLTKRMKQALKSARDRGVSIKILTNSVHSSEAPYRYHVSRATSSPFMESVGIEMYEFLPNKALHSKYMIVDGTYIYVGGFNLGPRSERINSETGVIIESPKIGQDLQNEINHRLSLSEPSPPYNWRQNPCMHILGGTIGSQM